MTQLCIEQDDILDASDVSILSITNLILVTVGRRMITTGTSWMLISSQEVSDNAMFSDTN